VDSRRPTWSFRVGSALVVASFAIYPTYPLIAILPVAVKTRVFGELAAWVVSWALFCVGTALTGKDAIAYVKHLLTGRTAARPK
jgi:hypothetical protein